MIRKHISILLRDRPIKHRCTDCTDRVYRLGNRLNVAAPGRRGITAETALRLALYFGTDARSWMNLQRNYALERAARDKAAALDAIRPRARV